MSHQSLKDIIQNEPLISRVFNSGADCFLVGGYVRDALMGIRSKDMDFVVRGDVKAAAGKILSKTGGSLVEFKKAGMVRLVSGDATLDFSKLRGSIEDDLLLRDFTMNALAWGDRRSLIDPFGGEADIKKGVIRALSESNLVQDPLRLLRAYRFAGELGWKIDVKTRGYVKRLNRLTKTSAPERITSELFMLLNSDNYLPALRTAYKDGLLQQILSFNNNKLQDNIKGFSRLESFLKNLPERYKATVDKPFSQRLSYMGLLRLEHLLTGSALGKNRLVLSRSVMKSLGNTGRLIGVYGRKRKNGRGAMFDMFIEAGCSAIDFALLTRSKRLLREAERFVSLKPALSAGEIIRITQAQGPKIGKLMNEMKRLQFIGKIGSEKAALSWLAVLTK